MNHDDTAMPPPREPLLTPAQNEHARRVLLHIEAQIARAGGWLSFEQFMDHALYAPGLGYYSAGAHKLGPGGDFTTAPEISRLFGGCVARQCAQVLGALGGGSVLEIGAGSGRLAVDVLRRLETLDRLPDHYSILEISADLRERQRLLLTAELPHLLSRVRWLDAPPSHPFQGVIIANEVLDALPMVRFSWWPDRSEEWGVIVEGDTLSCSARPSNAGLQSAVESLAVAAGGEWPHGYTSEICMRMRTWSAEVTASLRAGAVLWFDYGLPRSQFYLAERNQGTLLSYFRHGAIDDVLRHPGLQDITAWVDFTALAESGDAAGFEIAGFTNQTYFLAGAGIEEERLLLTRLGLAPALLSGQAQRLMLPGEMGERFKAMAWTRGLDAELIGFSIRDFLHTL